MSYEIPGFEIIGRIGSSCMTEVWQAYQKSLQRQVCIKILKPEYAAVEAEVRQFIDEAKLSARLNHPAIVAIYDAVEASPASFLVMELVDGPSVYELLAKGAPLSVSRTLRIAECVADGLRYAYNEMRMIHRNITPRCMRIDKDGAIKLSYVGISLRVDPINPECCYPSDTIVGTPHYISPEQARGTGTLDCRSDMYALGASLYHMLTGRVPFGDLSPKEALRAQQQDYLTPPQRINEAIPRNVVMVLEKLMMRDPDNRYATWDDALAGLKGATTSRIVIHKRTSPSDCVISPPPRNWTKPGPPGAGRRPIVIKKGALEQAATPQPKRRVRLVKRTS
jgi:eukaryotic-like serine/threonine-protein kinase